MPKLAFAYHTDAIPPADLKRGLRANRIQMWVAFQSRGTEQSFGQATLFVLQSHHVPELFCEYIR